MVSSSLLPFALVIGAILGGFCFFRSVNSLATALHFLVLVVIFGGIVAANLGGGGYAIVFRDLCIVLPIYIGVFATHAGRQALSSLPLDISLTLAFLTLVFAVCLLNPVAAPLAQIVIGLKVWLFYIPFLAVGLLIAYQPELLLALFRQILLWGAVACAVGLLQSLLVRVVGYDTAIRLFFGEHASGVTQGFTRFDEAGGIYRIPATFSFVAQYSGFLYLYMTIAMIAVNVDPDERIRRLASFAIFIALVAAILSGGRAAILAFPAMLVVYGLCGLMSSRLLMVAPIGIALGMGALAVATVNPVEYFRVGERLLAANVDDFVFQQISDALDNGVAGMGIGASTVAARYALGGAASDEVAGVFFESYFAKAAAELGLFGLAAIVALFLVIAWRVVVTVQANFRRPGDAIVIPIAIYLAFNILMSFKGSVLDTDPQSIFFWLLLGVMIGTDYLARRGGAPDHEAVAPRYADGFE